MNRIRNFLLCLVLLGLSWDPAPPVAANVATSGIVTPASAAILSNGSGQSCNGTGKWHFVNNQRVARAAPITAMFICNESMVSVGPVQPSACLSSVDHYNVTTSGSCGL